MEIFIKLYNDSLVRIFDTKVDKKKEVTLTTVSDFQDEAEAEFYVKNKKIKTLIFKNLPPAKARVLSLPVIVELLDKKTFKISYTGYDTKIENYQFKLDKPEKPKKTEEEKQQQKKNILKIILIAFLVLLIPLFILLFIKFCSSDLFNKINDINKNKTNEETKKEGDNKIVEPLYTIDSLKSFISENSPLYFVMDKADLLPGEIDKTNKISEYLKNYSKVEITINGHTEDIDKPQNEAALSIKRAKYIKELLADALQAKKFVYNTKGFGATKKAVENAPKDKKYLNRRVEFEVISAE